MPSRGAMAALVIVVVSLAGMAATGCGQSVPSAAPTSVVGSSSVTVLNPESCQLGALASVQRPGYPPGRAPAAGETPQTSAQAVSLARRSGTSSADDAPVVTRLMSFAKFGSLAGFPQEPSIGPTRCVWVTTVDAPIAVRSTPASETGPGTRPDYTVVSDEATGVGVLTIAQAVLSESPRHHLPPRNTAVGVRR
jgi:hypothetical protein